MNAKKTSFTNIEMFSYILSKVCRKSEFICYEIKLQNYFVYSLYIEKSDNMVIKD